MFSRAEAKWFRNSQMWRKRVGVEPTIRLAKSRIAGFEGRDSHRTIFASAWIITAESKRAKNCTCRQARVQMMSGTFLIGVSRIIRSGNGEPADKYFLRIFPAGVSYEAWPLARPTSCWNSGSSCRQRRSESLATQFKFPYPALIAFLSVSSASAFFPRTP